jgi:acetate kinase
MSFCFTADIWEYSVPARVTLCGKLAWLGAKFAEKACASGVPHFSASDIHASVWVIPTNKEMMIAQDTVTLSPG